MFPYVYKKYPVLDLSFKLINKHIVNDVKKYQNEIITTKFTDFILYKLFSNKQNINMNLDKYNDLQKSILINIVRTIICYFELNTKYITHAFNNLHAFNFVNVKFLKTQDNPEIIDDSHKYIKMVHNFPAFVIIPSKLVGGSSYKHIYKYLINKYLLN
jgi:vacuolar-type H+-ATPase subunit F/Vma7